MGMASILSRPIVSTYLSVEFRYRCLMNRLINPRPSEFPLLPNKEAIHILWSRDGNLDNRPGSWYVPNHFVPLCVVTAEPSASEKQEFPSTSTSGTRKPKQGTLFLFLKPKASTVMSANFLNDPPAKPNVSKRTASTAGHNNKTEEPDVKKSMPNTAALKVEGRVSLADYSRRR